MNTAFYAGSFDPFTIGHLHVLLRAVQLFDKVVIGIGIHPTKKRRFDSDIMKNAIEDLICKRNLTNVSVVCYDNLTVDAAKEHGATFLIRGIRNGMDYEYEENIATINEQISGIDTIYVRAGNHGFVSSSMVMELLKHGKDVSEYLPEEIFKII